MYRFFFFFSSRRRHTRYWRDWSSDVCSSDLVLARAPSTYFMLTGTSTLSTSTPYSGRENSAMYLVTFSGFTRSEERRVGKSVDLGGRRIIKKKKNKQMRSRLMIIAKKTQKNH